MENINFITTYLNNLGCKTLEIIKSKNQLLRKIHIKNNDKLLISLQEFIFIWSKIPQYKILSKLLGLLIIYQVTFISYDMLAFLLY